MNCSGPSVHQLHHESIIPTVFSAFAFHPLGALAQFIFSPVALMVFPIHFMALGVVFIILTVFGTFNHSGHEFFRHKLLLKWLIGASHMMAITGISKLISVCALPFGID